jgi:hypothetical protein
MTRWEHENIRDSSDSAVTWFFFQKPASEIFSPSSIDRLAFESRPTQSKAKPKLIAKDNERIALFVKVHSRIVVPSKIGSHWLNMSKKIRAPTPHCSSDDALRFRSYTRFVPLRRSGGQRPAYHLESYLFCLMNDILHLQTTRIRCSLDSTQKICPHVDNCLPLADRWY